MSNEKKPENVGVSNPYALAEVILKKKVNWKKVDTQKLLEKTFSMPYEKLFDPKFDSPLYTGLKLDSNTKALERVDVSSTAHIASKALVDVCGSTVWADPGIFFEEAAELNDPVQGAVGNCYFIAALSSVSWARTYTIAQRTRATGMGNQNFVDMIEFYRAYRNGKPGKVEVTELLPLNSPGHTFIYARSFETGEIWPAVYEKAFAKWITNDPGDKPDILKTAGGDPVAVTASLVQASNPYYYWNSDLSEDQIWQKVIENCSKCKTFNPMVAWTYETAPSPDVKYANAHIAANHAYSILGHQTTNRQRYIVLRNPWGNYDAILSVAGGTWIAWDAPYNSGPGWWRPIPMATNDGIFALDIDAFKKYYAGFGVVK